MGETGYSWFDHNSRVRDCILLYFSTFYEEFHFPFIRTECTTRPKKWGIEDARKLIKSRTEGSLSKKSVYMWKNGRRRKSRVAGPRAWQPFYLFSNIDDTSIYTALRAVIIQEHRHLEEAALLCSDLRLWSDGGRRLANENSVLAASRN